MENAGSTFDDGVFWRGGGKVCGNDSVVANDVIRLVSNTGKLGRPSDLGTGNRIGGGVDASGSTHHVIGGRIVLVVGAFAHACSTRVAAVFAEPMCVAVSEGFRRGVTSWNGPASAIAGELGNFLLQSGNLVTEVTGCRRSMYCVGCVESDGLGRGS